MLKEQVTNAEFDRKSAECVATFKALHDHFQGKPPLILFDEDDGPVAFTIDKVGHVHRVHRELSWQDEAVFLSDSEENASDAVERAIREDR